MTSWYSLCADTASSVLPDIPGVCGIHSGDWSCDPETAALHHRHWRAEGEGRLFSPTTPRRRGGMSEPTPRPSPSSPGAHSTSDPAQVHPGGRPLGETAAQCFVSKQQAVTIPAKGWGLLQRKSAPRMSGARVKFVAVPLKKKERVRIRNYLTDFSYYLWGFSE